MTVFDLNQLDQYVQFSKFTKEKHPSANIYIYGYDMRKPGSAIIWDEINMHMRGLILDRQGRVQQRSFQKFFTFKKYITKDKIMLTEGQVLKLPECKYKIYEKVDGSMALLYWVKDKPYLASQRSFSSPNALNATEILYSKYSHVFGRLNWNYTYIFEAISPTTRVMVNYEDREDLVLLGIVDNKTGKDVPMTKIGFPLAEDFSKEYSHIKDFEHLINLNIRHLEGFVLHYENGIRIKLKFPWFTEAHNIVNSIITHNRSIYENKIKLSKLLDLPYKRMSTLTLWSALRDELPLEMLLMQVSEEFFTVGFEHWVSENLLRLRSEFDKVRFERQDLHDNQIWDLIKPAEAEYFNVEERRFLPRFSTPMWNLFSRINNSTL